jgi:hypothetical protein
MVRYRRREAPESGFSSSYATVSWTVMPCCGGRLLPTRARPHPGLPHKCAAGCDRDLCCSCGTATPADISPPASSRLRLSIRFDSQAAEMHRWRGIGWNHAGYAWYTAALQALRGRFSTCRHASRCIIALCCRSPHAGGIGVGEPER